jgi:putative N6-adenine-specific DNA methylase
MPSDLHILFLPCPRGLEAMLVAEMQRLGSPTLRVGEAVASGVPARGTLEDVMRLNLHSRIASRVLLRMGRAPMAQADDVYQLALKLPWERWFTPAQTLRVDVTADRIHSADSSTRPAMQIQQAPPRATGRAVWPGTTSATFPSTKPQPGAWAVPRAGAAVSQPAAVFSDNFLFTALRAKDGVCDHFRARGEERPSVDREQPDIRIHLHLGASEALLYLDTSGEVLFKRGWRAAHGEAPLKENLAAGLLMLAGWTPDAVLFDPLCGAGTLVIEAAQMACNMAPGLKRVFGFERLLGFDCAVWQGLRREATAARRDAPAPIHAADIDPRMVAMAQDNARIAGVEQAIRFKQADVMDAMPPVALGSVQVGHLVTNPPYAERIEAKGSEADDFLPRLGDVLKQRFSGWNAALLLADLKAERALRLKPTRRHVVYNGAIECRLFTFALVTGRPQRKPGAAADEGVSASAAKPPTAPA